MAIVEVKVPQLSESVSEATLLQWKKKPGEAVKVDEILIEIETDKVVLEVPAPSAGVMGTPKKDSGATVTSGEVITTIDTEGKADTQGKDADGGGKAQSAPAPASGGAAPAPTKRGEPVAMPAAAKMLAEAGLPAGAVAGTGKDGRILKGDVVAAQAALKSSAPAPSASKTALADVKAPMDLAGLADRPMQRVPMSRLRQRVAERLVQSQSTAAILTTFNEVNMQPVMDLRAKYKDRFEKEHGVKLGFMSFFVKAALAALKKFPVVNASVDGADIVYHGYFDIGVAVGSPRGLVVPVLRDVDQMSFADIEKKIVDFGQRAAAGKLAIEELTGGTFSISNGGVFGSMLSTPIINPPQSAILGVHATRERAVVEDGQIVIRPMNYLALSYDHRIIDGREAVLSLVAMKEALEDPARLLLEL